MKKIQISPSILSADFSQLGKEIKRLEEAGADLIHVDVMDGHFVPNLTIGPPVIKALKKNCSIKFDVHLMISPVHKYIEAYSDAGADIITIHPEATEDLSASISKIKELKIIVTERTAIKELNIYFGLIDFLKKKIIKLLIKILYKKASTIITNSTKSSKDLAKIVKLKINTIFYGSKLECRS